MDQSTFTFDLFTGPLPEDYVNDTGEPVMTLTIDDGRTVQTFYISEAEFREYYDKFYEVAEYLQWKENQETLRDLLLD